MDDIKPTPEDLARDLRADLAALLRATPEAQWEWGEDDLWDFVHHAKAAGIAGARRALAAEAIIAWHDLCHNLRGQVDARAFADGCAGEQRKLYGCAPDADEVARLRAALERIACRDQGEVGPHMEEPRSAAIAREVLG